MGKYHIHIDPPKPDPQQIKRHQDFDSLYDHYQVQTRFEFWRRLYRNPRNFALVALVAGLVVLVFQANESESQDMMNLAGAPFPALVPEFQDIILDPTKDTSLNIGRGLELAVPAFAFSDSVGAAVRSQVILKLRHLPNTYAWMLAGISTQFGDQANCVREGELLELYALTNGDSVQLDPSRPLLLKPNDILEDSSQFPQLLQLNPLQQWEINTPWLAHLVADTQAMLALGPPPKRVGTPEIPTTELDQVARLSFAPPQRPFGVKVDNLADFPAFRGYESVYWAYVAGPNSTDPWASDMVNPTKPWDQIRVKRAGDKYRLVFRRVTEDGGYLQKEVLASPLFEARTSAEADQIYRKQLADYEAAIDTPTKDTIGLHPTSDPIWLDWQRAYDQANQPIGYGLTGQITQLGATAWGRISSMPVQPDAQPQSVYRFGEKWVRIAVGKEKVKISQWPVGGEASEGRDTTLNRAAVNAGEVLQIWLDR